MDRMTFLDLLKSKTVLFDGAMGTLLLSQNLTPEDHRGRESCCEILNITRPDLIEQIHTRYLQAGADAIETNTFQGSRLKLEEFGFGDETYEINLAAAQAARRAVDRFPGPDKLRFVVGSIGPTARLPSSTDPQLTVPFPRIREILFEQASVLIEGGVDALVLETQQDILETKAGIFGIRDAFRKTGRSVPILVHIALDKNGRMLMGTDVIAACSILEGLEVDCIGIDCSFGPEEMREFIRILAENCSRHVGCVPNAGLPENRDGVPYYPLGPVEMAESLAGLAQQYGIDIIGGCCGTTPEHIRAIHERLKHMKPVKRRVERLPCVSSPFKRVLLHQEPKPLVIGERLNVAGSKKTKEMVEKGDYQGLASIASEQESRGCHLLDVCMAGPEEKERMVKTVRLLSQSVEAPLVIDSRDEEVIEAALEVYPGRGVVNSVNLEKGRESLSRTLSIVKEYGACVVAMTITESGMALTAEDKLKAAARIREISDECGLAASDLLFDCLTLPLCTGDEKYRESARETLEGIGKIKEALPDVMTILGISNVSYGLNSEARIILNSVFLYHAIRHGLDAAIVNAGEIIPYREISARERELCENLIFNREKNPLSDLMESIRAKERLREVRKESPPEPSVEGAIKSRILNRTPQGLEELLERALQAMSAEKIISKILLPAMEEVGRRFDSGEMILPFVLQSAEVMSRATGYLERHLGKEKVKERGKLVLATVFGDVHDIGKNLVRSVISSNGYTVYDLGKRVPVDDIITKAKATEADAIGLSALLVSTSKEMKTCVRELSRMGMEIPVIVGGAPTSPSFARRISVLEDGSIYPGGVFYARDAFQGLEILNSLVQEREPTLEHYRTDVLNRLNKGGVRKEAEGERIRPGITRERIIAPFIGTESIKDIPADEIFRYLDLDSLFRARWQAKKRYTSELREKEFLPAFQELKTGLIRKKVMKLSLVYGYFDCEVSGDSLVIHNKDEKVALNFARRSGLTKYFLPQGGKDVAALGVVTIGAGPGELESELMRKGETKKAFYLHGLSAETAEALAEYLEAKIRLELGLKRGFGKRFSPGYPSWPNLSEQKKIFSVMKPEEIGVTLTEAFQMVPEHSVSFLLCPRARAARRRRAGGL